MPCARTCVSIRPNRCGRDDRLQSSGGLGLKSRQFDRRRLNRVLERNRSSVVAPCGVFLAAFDMETRRLLGPFAKAESRKGFLPVLKWLRGG